MTSPNFKVLVNALQLGQPPDVASIRAVVEQMLAQQEEISALRRQVAMLHNRMAALMLTAEPEMGGAHGTVPTNVDDTGPVALPPQSEPHRDPQGYANPRQGYADQPQGYADQRQGYADGGYGAEPELSAYSERAGSPYSEPYAESPVSSGRGHPDSSGREAASPPVNAANPGQLRGRRINTGVPSVVEDFESSEYEDFQGTVVIKGGEVKRPRRSGEAPFPIAPAGPPPRHVSEIPGAPWAREQAGAAPLATPRGGGPDIYETYTVDSAPSNPARAEARPQAYEGEPADAPPRVDTDFEDEGSELQRTHRRRERS